MEFHYVVVYDSENKSWGIADEVEGYFPDGTVWDGEEWFWPDFDRYDEIHTIDQRAYTMLRTLASIWPEVDHGN